MSYEFALDKKSLISVIVGWVVIAVLLFFSGWIVGRQWPMSELASTPSANAEEQRAELPKEPVLNEEPAAPNTAAPKTAKPKVESPTAQPPATTTAAAPQAATAVAAPPVTDGQVAIISEADADPANKTAAVDPEYVTVQVGVFLDEKDASRLLKQIEQKGYAPSFFTGRDAEARQWYAVRIGAYSDKQQAANAAANFTKQEKMKAVVRPVGSL